MAEEQERPNRVPNIDDSVKRATALKVLCSLIKNPTICPQSHVGHADTFMEDAFTIAEKFDKLSKEKYGV